MRKLWMFQEVFRTTAIFIFVAALHRNDFDYKTTACKRPSQFSLLLN
jgi:hypothetical protein